MIWAQWFLRFFCPIMAGRAFADLVHTSSLLTIVICGIATPIHLFIAYYFWVRVPLRWRRG